MPLTNTSHKQMTQALTDLQADLLNNPYYLFNDKKANLVEYYNLNTTKSLLDEALRIPYENLGPNSPLRFNIIHGFYLYGLERISVNLDEGDFGLESSEITGEAFVIPNTIYPYPGDYFTMHTDMKKDYLFKVISVNMDTLNDGSNFWKIEYKLDRLSDDKLKYLVIDEFEFIPDNIGTNFNAIIKKTKWDLATQLDDLAVLLKKYFKALFYNERVQTYTTVFLYQVCRSNRATDYFYDPYLIEFIIRNKITKNDGDKYVYVGHRTTLSPEFPIRYSKSIWRALEKRDLDMIPSCLISSYGVIISDPATIFATRYEDYFELVYSNNPAIENIAEPVQIIDPQIIGHIIDHQLFEQDSSYAKYNILIKYMYGEDIGVEDLIPFEQLSDDDMSSENYFFLPMAIFCLEYYVKKLLSKTS